MFYYFLHFQGKYAFINVRHMILQKIVVYIKTTLVMEFQVPIVSSFQKIWSWNLFLKTYSCNEFIFFHYVSNFHTSQVWKSFLKKLKKVNRFIQTASFYSKLINLKLYNIICWFAGTNDSSTKGLMFQALFSFIISYTFRAIKTH